MRKRILSTLVKNKLYKKNEQLSEEAKYFTGEEHICCPFTHLDIYTFDSNDEEHKYFIDYKMKMEPKMCKGNCEICQNVITMADEEYSLQYFRNWKFHILYNLEIFIGYYFIFLIPCTLFGLYQDSVWWTGFVLALFCAFLILALRICLLVDTDKLFVEWAKEKYKEKISIRVRKNVPK